MTSGIAVGKAAEVKINRLYGRISDGKSPSGTALHFNYGKMAFYESVKCGVCNARKER
jgi:hypothetical protein